MINITQMLTSYNYSNGNNRKIQYIVIHYFGSIASARNTATYFANAYRGASAHYCVDDSSIYQCVEDKNISWHCGTDGTYYHKYCRNSNSIGIEVKPLKINASSIRADDKDWYFTDKTIQNTIDLVKMLMKKYNIPIENVIRHYDVTHKWCPRPFMGTDINTYYKTTGDAQWQKFKTRLNNEIKGEDDMTKEEVNALLRGANTAESAWAKEEIEKAKEYGITDGSRMQGYATRQETAIMVERSMDKTLKKIDELNAKIDKISEKIDNFDCGKIDAADVIAEIVKRLG